MISAMHEEHSHEEHEDHCAHHQSKPWYQNKTFIVLCVLVTPVLLSYSVSFLIPFREALFMYTQKIWWALLLGLFIGGVIDRFIPQEYVSHVLASSKKRTILHAVLYGFLMSVCSHGILALAIQLHKKGASTPSVVTFLLASPWANLPITLILISFFGLIQALYIIIAALVIAVNTGLVYLLLENAGLVEKNIHSVDTPEDFSIWKDIKERNKNYRFSSEQLRSDTKGIYKGAVTLANMVLWWILIGMGLASLAGAYIPSEFFNQYMGPSFGGMMVTLLVATILEVCSEGTAPLAFEVYRQTGALGNALVFLMAGVATDYTEIGLLWANVGHKTAIWLPIIAVPQIILFGIIANHLF